MIMGTFTSITLILTFCGFNACKTQDFIEYLPSCTKFLGRIRNHDINESVACKNTLDVT